MSSSTHTQWRPMTPPLLPPTPDGGTEGPMGTVTHLPSYLGHMEETGTVKFENLWYFLQPIPERKISVTLKERTKSKVYAPPLPWDN